MANAEQDSEPESPVWPPPPAGTEAAPDLSAPDAGPGVLTCVFASLLGIAGVYAVLVGVIALGCLARDVIENAVSTEPVRESGRHLMLYSCEMAAAIMAALAVLFVVPLMAARSSEKDPRGGVPNK